VHGIARAGVLRTSDGGERQVTPLELFFDLVYVFAVTQLYCSVRFYGLAEAEGDAGGEADGEAVGDEAGDDVGCPVAAGETGADEPPGAAVGLEVE
jgi:hypothetical protein